MINLKNFHKQIYSQSGEDGILLKIFDTLKIDFGWFCEFGAGDGKNIANSRIFQEKEWSGVLIEGDDIRFNDLIKDPNMINENGFYPINAYISCEPGEKIDELLASTPIPKDFDLLSIDIDGNDLWVWKSLENYRPKVVIIEYNSHFTVDKSVTIKYDRNHRFSYDNYYGANAGALIKLAEEKGYELIAFTTGLNLVFIDKKYNKFQIIDPSDIKLHIGWPPSNKEMITY